MKVRVTRDVPASENYSGRAFKEGDILYTFHGATYGCIDTWGGGIALSEVDGENPFFEFPSNAIEYITE